MSRRDAPGAPRLRRASSAWPVVAHTTGPAHTMLFYEASMLWFVAGTSGVVHAWHSQLMMRVANSPGNRSHCHLYAVTESTSGAGGRPVKDLEYSKPTRQSHYVYLYNVLLRYIEFHANTVLGTKPGTICTWYRRYMVQGTVPLTTSTTTSFTGTGTYLHSGPPSLGPDSALGSLRCIPRLRIANPEARDACFYPKPRARAIPRARVGPEARGSVRYE